MSCRDDAGTPLFDTILSMMPYVGASWPHLKLLKSRRATFGCRDANFAAHTFCAELAE